MADYYYTLSLTTSGVATTGAYYYVTITNGSGAYDGAAVTLYPTGVSATYFNYRANSLQWQAPPSRVSAGMTVVTSGNNITGLLGASPALNVAVTLTCYGASGPIGTVTLPAGQSEIPFNFAVTPGESYPGGGGEDLLAKLAPKPE